MAVKRYVGPVGSLAGRARPSCDNTGPQWPWHRPKPSVPRHYATATCRGHFGRVDRVILVGHSYAGMIISGVVETNPAQVRRLFSWMRSSRKMDKAYWTCSRPRLAPTFVASHETMEVAGGYQAERDNLTSGDLSRARHVSSCAQDCAILVFIALKSPLGFRPIGRPAFRPPSLPALRKNIRRGRSAPFAAKARASGWEVAELKTGHDCHVERPGEVANILLADALSQ